VLLESQASSEGRLDWLVIGMGVNLATYPEGLEFPAISLKAAGSVVTLEALLVAVAERFLFWYERWRAAGFASLREPWLARAQGLGGEIRVRLQAGELLGRFAGLDEEGALLLEDGAGRRRIAAGDIFPLGR
jgi:BirA family biotin operon repressor/biotin-[acetyl-CoA-carboxylase] ligase